MEQVSVHRADEGHADGACDGFIACAGIAHAVGVTDVARDGCAAGAVSSVAEALEASRPSRCVALGVAYDGAPFAGFARQAESHVTTVQGELERVLSVLYRRAVDTVCAGRTDAGVHALGQVVSFDLTEEEFASRPLRTLMKSMNALVDERITVTCAEERPAGFSARFDATSREYRYFIATGNARPVLIARSVWHLHGAPLDVDAMNAAARLLVGEHDFKSFCVASSALHLEGEGRSTCRRVIEADVRSTHVMGTPVVEVRIVGNAFLHSMIRIIVGTLVAVGQGRRDASWVADVLAARDRTAAGETAPACGLTFWSVRY